MFLSITFLPLQKNALDSYFALNSSSVILSISLGSVPSISIILLLLYGHAFKHLSQPYMQLSNNLLFPTFFFDVT